METANKLLLFFFVLFSMTGCTQEKNKNIEDEEYFTFKRSVYQLDKSLTKHKMSTVVVNECIFNGFVLAIVDVNQQGKATFELVYASSEFFKEVFFEPLKNVATSSLEKGKKYLVPISYHVNRTKTFSEECISVEKYYSIPIIGNKTEEIDYAFKPFEFFWLTPIEGKKPLNKEDLDFFDKNQE